MKEKQVVGRDINLRFGMLIRRREGRRWMMEVGEEEEEEEEEKGVNRQRKEREREKKLFFF